MTNQKQEIIERLLRTEHVLNNIRYQDSISVKDSSRFNKVSMSLMEIRSEIKGYLVNKKY